jgi:ornithine cyclodeaminase/alanine dehydrogenase-like protein (mu-crystallin family)
MPNQQNIRYLNAREVKSCLPMDAAINAMRNAFIQLSAGAAVVPQRIHMQIPGKNGLGLYMPVYLPDTEKTAVKIVSVANDNAKKDLPLIHAIVMVSDAATGIPLAIMDGSVLTAIRTGAASGFATDLLAPKQASIVAIFGAGVQGRTQLEAVASVRPIDQIYIFDIDSERAEKFAAEMCLKLTKNVYLGKQEIDLPKADIICTATTSKVPVFDHRNLKPGVHINGVGSYTPEMQELPAETVRKAKLVVDTYQSCLSEAGEIINAIKLGEISEDHIFAELGEIASGKKFGRISDREITLFKSVGNAVQDLAVANVVLENAEKNNIGSLFQR